MYYNKVRKTVHHWWHTYLLFKCSIVVLPIYSALIIAGLYCLMYNIDVNAPLKTVYQFFILILSAAVIFIFVLLLATFNGDNRPPPEGEPTEGIEVDLDSIALPSRGRRGSFGRGGREGRNRSSMTSSIMSAIFGYYNEDEDADLDDEDFLDPEDLMTLAAAGIHDPRNHRSPNIPTFDDIPPLIMHQAENGLVTSLERATDELEFFLNQCNDFGLCPELSPEDHMITPPRLTSKLYNQQHRPYSTQPLPPPGYYDMPSSSSYARATAALTNYQLESTSILPPSGAPPPTYGHLAPPMPPIYSSNTGHNNGAPNTEPNPSTNSASSSTCIDMSRIPIQTGQSTSRNFLTARSATSTSTSGHPQQRHDLPPSYEEAIGHSSQ